MIITLNSNTGGKFLKRYRTILFMADWVLVVPNLLQLGDFHQGSTDLNWFNKAYLATGTGTKETARPTSQGLKSAYLLRMSHTRSRVQPTMNDKQSVTDKAATSALGLQQQTMLLRLHLQTRIKQKTCRKTCNPRHQARGLRIHTAQEAQVLNRKLQALSNYYKLRFTTSTDATIGINIAFVQVAPITGTRW